MTTRSMAGSNPASRISARPGLSGRSLRLSERIRRRARAAQARQRHGDGRCRAGAGRGGDRRCLCLPHLCRYRPAAASRRSSRPTTARPRSCRRRRMAAKTPDRMVPGDGGEKIVSREESAGRRQFQGRPAHRVSATEPERQPAASRERHDRLRRRRPRLRTARFRTASRARSRRSPSRAIAENGGVPRRRWRHLLRSRRSRRRTHRRRASARNPASANASANGPLSLSPQGGAQPEPAPTADGLRSRPRTGRGSGGYVVQVSSQKNEADAQASYRALQGKFPSVLGSQSPLDQARRSRREGRLLPRDGRSVQFGGPGDTGL